jgi:hemolysin activation/secretion protein
VAAFPENGTAFGSCVTDRMPALSQSLKLSRKIFLAFMVCRSVSAQFVPPSDAEEQRRRTQQESEERQRLQQSPNVRLQSLDPIPEDESSLTLPAETPSFKISRFVLEVPKQLPPPIRAKGASSGLLDPFHFAMAYLSQYSGKQIGPEGLNTIVRRLTRLILAKGYSTTRVGIPEQDLTSGTLTLTLIPGVIRAVRFSDPSIRGTWKNAFPLSPGDLLNVRDLEQGLEQMKRLPGQDVDINIVPGALPGESDIVLSVKRGKPWRVTTNLDDSGMHSTGQWQGGLTMALDNPLGISDVFNAGWTHDVTRYRKGSGTRGANLYYSVPFGFWTFTSTWNEYDYEQRIAGISQDFVSSGDSQNVDFKVGYLFHRNQAMKDTLQFRTGNRRSRSFLDSTELDVQHRRTSFAEVSWVHMHYLGRAQLDVTTTYRQGVTWFGAQDDFESGPNPSPTFFYRLETLDASLAVPFTIGGHGLRDTATFRGQHTSSLLFASEFFTIGNRWTVRGFDGESTLASENGSFFRNDLECPIAQGRQSLYLGVDEGRIYGTNEKALLGQSIVGAVLGVKGVIGKGLYFDLFVGGPLRQPDRFPNRWPVVGISVSYQK